MCLYQCIDDAFIHDECIYYACIHGACIDCAQYAHYARIHDSRSWMLTNETDMHAISYCIPFNTAVRQMNKTTIEKILQFAEIQVSEGLKGEARREF